MLNDPYIDIIRKAKQLDLDEVTVENSINIFLSKGSDKTFFHLVHENKVPEEEAGKLIDVIKKEFRSFYYHNSLYSGVFMLLFLFLSFDLFWFSDSIGFMMVFSFVVFLYCGYLFVKSLVKASKMK